MSTIERRLNKLEEIRNRNDVGDEVDKLFEKMGTSRAAMLADFGSLWKFRDWLVARSAAADHQALMGRCTGFEAVTTGITIHRSRHFSTLNGTHEIQKTA